MIGNWILAKGIGRLFGQGFAADLAGRGMVYLADGARDAWRREDQRVTLARLQPGESYTVIARPRPTRAERKLAAAHDSVKQRYERATRPTRAQLRAARRLARVQRRLDRVPEGSRRHAKLSAREQRRGARFDRVKTPSRRQARLAARLEVLDARLGEERERNFERARRSVRRRPERSKVRVYT